MPQNKKPVKQRLAIITSGGDAPGMNASIRAITLKALQNGYDVIGFIAGFHGLINAEFIQLDLKSVDNIIHKGGTILKTARCKDMFNEQGVKKASCTLNNLDIESLIVIGGDGSFKGAQALSEYWHGQIIGIPGTIDNDINGTDQTIGFWTAIDTALDCIDKIRDTADAFDRIFVIEVMGRDCGFIAMESGIASGAQQIICHELISDEADFIQQLLISIKKASKQSYPQSYVIVVAENALSFSTAELAKKISEYTQVDTRSAILGYVQRGGAPVAMDRVLATQLGIKAVEAINKQKRNLMIGMSKGEIITFPLSQTGLKNKTNKDLIKRLEQFSFNLTI
ncbi:6-phosphofructokinase 1 [Pseudoalteromonas denitrificans DSM 6059]|uniref:6-phosphofructokinase n=2 Tax=Pseudoalteromonas TaxID=53246 RepID=A0A1I1QKN6_9GAMM|nr:6-phosphofructokinase 1 [Pseudoalteromonas denitrificans DSM 6059]